MTFGAQPHSARFLGRGASTIVVETRGLRLPTHGRTPIDHMIQDAIRALDPVVGGVVRIPPGSHVVDSVDLDTDARPVTLDLRDATLTKATPTEGGTVGHMFASPYGAADGLRVIGGTIDLSRDAFEFGQTVSAFYGVRPDDWGFYGTRFVNGVEEGLKLYMPRKIRVIGCDFERIADNGVQLHNIAMMPSGAGHKPDRTAEDLQVIDSAFVGINDGSSRGALNGQGVAFSSAHSRFGIRDGLVLACRAEQCIRGFWAEFNRAGVAGENIRFMDNVVRRSEFHGMGFVGVRGGSMRGNILTDIGEMRPSRGTSSEVFGLQVSGSADNFSEDVLVDENVIRETRTGRGGQDPETDAFMEYGIVAKSCRRVTITARNRIEGALKRDIWVQRSAVDVTVP